MNRLEILHMHILDTIYLLSTAYRKCTVAAAYNLLMQGLPCIGNVAVETFL